MKRCVRCDEYAPERELAAYRGRCEDCANPPETWRSGIASALAGALHQSDREDMGRSAGQKEKSREQIGRT